MPLTDHAAINAALRRFDRLATLDESLLDQLAAGSELRYASRGSCLLALGAADPRQLFLIDGELELEAGDGATHRVRHTDSAARAPVSRLRPSRYRVTALSDVRYLLIDQQLLDDHVYAPPASTVVVEESYLVSEPNDLPDDSAGHPIMYELYQDLNLGRLLVPSDREVAVRVGRALNPLDADHARIAGVLAACPALTLKVLRAARAAVPRGPALRSPRAAVERLGADGIFSLTVNCVLRESLRSDSATVCERMRSWWERTVRVAAISDVLARSSERFDPSYAMLIGLLHSIAEPVLLGYADRHPDLADPGLLDDVVHGNRAELGRILLAMWGQPREVVAATSLCNRWGYDHSGAADYTDILMVAQWYALDVDRSGRRPPLIEEIPAFRRLGLHAPSVETHQRITAAAAGALDAIDRLLNTR